MSETRVSTELCAWCSKIIKYGAAMSPITHGICWNCSAIYFPKELAGIRAACNHDYEETVTDHDVDEEPVSTNPFTDAIRYRRICLEIVDRVCQSCGHEERGETRDCQEHSKD
jgi:hypothetical protein